MFSNSWEIGMFGNSWVMVMFSNCLARSMFRNSWVMGMFSNSWVTGMFSNSWVMGMFSNSWVMGMFSNSWVKGMLSNSWAMEMFSKRSPRVCRARYQMNQVWPAYPPSAMEGRQCRTSGPLALSRQVQFLYNLGILCIPSHWKHVGVKHEYCYTETNKS